LNDQRIVEVAKEAYCSYEEGLVALRMRVVGEMRRKLKQGGVLDQPLDGSTPRSAPPRKRRR